MFVSNVFITKVTNIAVNNKKITQVDLKHCNPQPQVAVLGNG